MPRWDFECSKCGDTQERAFTSRYAMLSAVYDEGLNCNKCGGEMKRLPSTPNFTIKGYNAKNGYTK